MDVFMLDPTKACGTPRVLEDVLEFSDRIAEGASVSYHLTCLAFNRCGTVLAAGCADGKVILIDFETRGLATVLKNEAPSEETTTAGAHRTQPNESSVAPAAPVAPVLPLGESGEGPSSKSADAETNAQGGVKDKELNEEEMKGKKLNEEGKEGETNGSGSGNTATVTTNVAVADSAANVAPHCAPVTSVSWSEDGTRLVTSCHSTVDNNVLLWDLKSEKVMKTFALPEGVVSTEINPTLPLILANLSKGPPTLLKFDGSPSERVQWKQEEQEEGSSNNNRCVGAFIERGTLVAVGKGSEITVLRTSTSDVVSQTKINNMSGILGFSYEDSSGTGTLALNCSGKNKSSFVCLLKLKDGKQTEFSNPSGVGWTTLSQDGSALLCTSDPEHSFEHQIYIWDIEQKSLDFVLSCPDGPVYQIVQQPQHATVVSLAKSGKAYVWTKMFSENWSAFAPGFRELLSNEEYVEAEDEFDQAVDNKMDMDNEAYTNEKITIH